MYFLYTILLFLFTLFIFAVISFLFKRTKNQKATKKQLKAETSYFCKTINKNLPSLTSNVVNTITDLSEEFSEVDKSLNALMGQIDELTPETILEGCGYDHSSCISFRTSFVQFLAQCNIESDMRTQIYSAMDDLRCMIEHGFNELNFNRKGPRSKILRESADSFEDLADSIKDKLAALILEKNHCLEFSYHRLTVFKLISEYRILEADDEMRKRITFLNQDKQANSLHSLNKSRKPFGFKNVSSHPSFLSKSKSIQDSDIMRDEVSDENSSFQLN